VSESQDLREFIREQSLIANRRMDQFAAELRRNTEEMRRHHDRQDAKLDDLLAESKAQRAALFAMIDRLNSGGGAAPA
jgi:t-SNARE complex subunit (syntaxin)